MESYTSQPASVLSRCCNHVKPPTGIRRRETQGAIRPPGMEHEWEFSLVIHLRITLTESQKLWCLNSRSRSFLNQSFHSLTLIRPFPTTKRCWKHSASFLRKRKTILDQKNVNARSWSHQNNNNNTNLMHN